MAQQPFHQFITGSALSGASQSAIDLYTILSVTASNLNSPNSILYFGTKDGATFTGQVTAVHVDDAKNGAVRANGTHFSAAGVSTPATAFWQMQNGAISLNIVALQGLKVLEDVPANPIQFFQIAMYV